VTDELADRPLWEPHSDRLPLDTPMRAVMLERHQRALDAGELGYLDPVRGLYVMTAATLAKRGKCCTNGCRHCPYVR